MKKHPQIFLYPLFTLLYAGFFSVGAKCLLDLLGCVMAMSLDGKSVAEQYPRYIPFCLVVGLLSLGALVLLAALNIKFRKKLKYNQTVWIIQFVCAFVISIPMIKVWELLFDFLQETF